MKNCVLAIAALATIAGSATAATTLAQWTFETSLPLTSGPHAAEGGVNAGPSSPASGFHTSGATAYSNPVGNGSAESFSSNNWSVGDYYQFSTSTLGYTAITIQWDQTSSNTGPRDFQLSASTDGVNYAAIGGTYAVLANSSPNPVWNSTTYSALYTFGPIAGSGSLDNQAAVFFRMTMNSTVSANGGTVAAAGTDRVDNVTISGVVPAPASMALVGIAGLIAGRRRR